MSFEEEFQRRLALVFEQECNQKPIGKITLETDERTYGSGCSTCDYTCTVMRLITWKKIVEIKCGLGDLIRRLEEVA